MGKNELFVKGAREHNLKNIDIHIPRDKLIVFTGLSGSGKSSLAFDTIYAEGQRRYVESLSSYARQFLGQMDKPDLDYIEGLSPAISIDQKTTSKNPRSTVGTVTENLRLPAPAVCAHRRAALPGVRAGESASRRSIRLSIRCWRCRSAPRIQVLAPVVRGRKGEHVKELESARRSGFVRVRCDGILYDLSEPIKLAKNSKHTIEIVVDRLVIQPSIRSRLADSLETAASLTGGICVVSVQDGEDYTFSQNYACPEHGASIEELTPRMFSFNNPYGACPKCTGLGVFMKIDPDRVIPDKSKSINGGGLKGAGWAMEGNSVAAMYLNALSEKYNFLARHAAGRAARPYSRHSALRHEGREAAPAPRDGGGRTACLRRRSRAL